MATITNFSHSVSVDPSDPNTLVMRAKIEVAFAPEEVSDNLLYGIQCWLFEEISTTPLGVVFPKDISSSRLVLFPPPSSSINQMKKPLTLQLHPQGASSASKVLEINVARDHVDPTAAKFSGVAVITSERDPTYAFTGATPVRAMR